MADVAKALAHPARIQILEILADRDSCMCGEIVDLLPLCQSTVSQHLKELKRVGFIKGEIEGPKICYYLDEEMIDRAKVAFAELFRKVTGGDRE
jgi:DNA-binding transcriptional ArsR family regulator